MSINTTISEDMIRSRLSRLYRSYGYLPYKVNKFEEYDLYAQYKNFLACKQILTFSDTDGRLMALKPDVTLSIVRNALFRPGCKQKLYYHETATDSVRFRRPGWNASARLGCTNLPK